MSHHNNIAIVKEAENSKNITARLNPYFIKSIGVFKMFKIYTRYTVNFFDNFERQKNSVLNFCGLSGIEFFKVVFIKEKGSFLCHFSKIVKSSLIGQL